MVDVSIRFSACVRNVRKAFVAASFLLLFLLVTISNVSAQVTTADVVGTVTDQTGAAVAGATVTIKNNGTSVTQIV